MSISPVQHSETPSAAVARRLREQLAGARITGVELAELLGVNQAYVSRRTTGMTPMDPDFLYAVEAVTGISAAYLFTGHGETRKGGGPKSAAEELPAGIEPATFSLQDGKSALIPFRPRISEGPEVSPGFEAEIFHFPSIVSAEVV